MRNKKNRENTRQRKQSHAQDNIYVVQQFAYVYGVAGISLLLGKNTKCKLRHKFFFSHIKHDHFETLITKLRFLHKTGLSKSPKPPFHGLSFSKSLIKNHATLFESGRVVKPDQTKLGSTKPNTSHSANCTSHFREFGVAG